uniref:SpoU_methylase domain-containing protein n=1 Tax=Steinernema glaseri TaxID=37863 RepID=A0A1I7ZLF8_9BILA
MRAIRMLQKKFKTCVGPDFFEGQAQREEFFVSYLKQMQQWSWAEVVYVSSALLMDRSEACQLAVKAAIQDKVSPALLLTMLREYISSQWELDDCFLETSMNSINYTLKRFALLVDEKQESGAAGTNVLVECVDILHEILPTLLNSAHQTLFNQLTKVIQYVEIFVQFLKQCHLDENGFGEQMDVDVPTEADVSESGVSEIYGIQPRVGVYQVRKDGTIYDREEGVKAFACVAEHVLQDDQQDVSYQRMNWQTLFTFLRTYNQSLLEVHTRSLATSLATAVEDGEFYSEDAYDSVFTACTKILSVPQGADLWLAAALICTLSEENYKSLLTDLKNWAVGKRNPRIIMSCLRVSQLMFAMKGDNQLWNQFAKRYTLMMWTKKLSKFKGQMPSPTQCQTIAVCVKEFVRCLLPPPVISKYCEDIDVDANELLAQYAFTLCVKSGSESDPTMQKKMIDLADAALLRLNTPNAFERIFNTLMVVCPYHYEVLQVLLRHLSRFAESDEDKQIVRELLVILDYLVNVPRQNESSGEEVKWYQERQKMIATVGSFTGQDVTLTDNAALNPDISGASDDFYERQEIVAKKLPSISEHRLPFHVFLVETELDKKNVLLPVINQELSITSVNVPVDYLCERLDRAHCLPRQVHQAEPN